MTRVLLSFALLTALSSCNTLIGIGRDTRQAFQWSRQQVQGGGQPAHPEPMATDAPTAPTDEMPVY